MAEYDFRMFDAYKDRTRELAGSMAAWLIAYRDRTVGMGRKARADREAQARTDALRLTIEYLQAVDRLQPTTQASVTKQADHFAEYILNGNKEEGN